MKLYTKWIIPFAAIAIVSCSSDDDATTGMPPAEEVEYSAGDADFTTYVSLGNSLTAGFSDGALFIAAQENSFPNLLANQFSVVGGGEFTQPLMNDNIGGLLFGGTQIQEPRLYFNGQAPVRLPATPTTDITQQLSGPFNNMGVPGAKSFHLLANGYGNLQGVPLGQANPYYARFASSASASVIEDAAVQDPSFFSLWIGANDVLGYATSGGDGDNQLNNFDPSTYGSNDISDPQVFASVYNNLLSVLTANGAGGVVANIPDVTGIPYFTTVPYNPVPLDAATAAFLNQQFAPYNQGLLQAEALQAISAEEREARTIVFAEGQNPVVIVDEYLTDLGAIGLPSYRQTKPEDLLVLPGASFIGTNVGGDPTLINGVSVPLEDRWVLTTDEIAEVQTATASFNQVISSLAGQYGLAFVDANAEFENISQGGVPFDEFTLTGDLVFGGLFSLDGIHLTARGNAYVANIMMGAIETSYNAVLPRYEAADFPTLYPADLPN
ncbi:G-D-S-L family lipolytic protein [Robertkochia aurantiaca]|uniref:G-D-S-L family lipolytic protein n=1 Tax=Robertkochia aurantiaca TaxID=2873700 RepID=UPI001CCF273D|nr:G-D-S-L family lipolytic protein [Robertkochia sp. 3YJGBD-33]